MDENVCICIMSASETVSTLLRAATREQFTALLSSFLVVFSFSGVWLFHYPPLKAFLIVFSNATC